MMKEQAIQAKIIRGLERKGFYVQKVVGQSRPGLPDIFAVISAEVCFFVEVKTSAGRLRDSQIREIADLVSSGFRVYLVAGEDSVQSFLDNCSSNYRLPQNRWDIGNLENIPHGSGWWFLERESDKEEGLS